MYNELCRALLRSAVLLAVPGLLTVQQQAAASRKTLQQVQLTAAMQI
jgi:hypothetical protein